VDRPPARDRPAAGPAAPRAWRKAILPAAVALWAAAAAGGSALLWRYEAAPCPAAAAPAHWPTGAGVTTDGRRHTLVMLLHPHCPCSRATVRELAVVMAAAAERLRAHVLFVRPDGVPAGWEQTDTWRDAAAIPGVTVADDEAGGEAARFGAATSGQAVLYDPAGRLVFRGGITPARGHSGDNAGRGAILAIVNGSAGQGEPHEAPVFGCPLRSPGGGATARDARDAREGRTVTDAR
jgi:hypothetical protein